MFDVWRSRFDEPGALPSLLREGGPRSGGRVLTQIQNPIMSPFSHARKAPVWCATSSDSEIGTQMMERTPPPQAVPSLLSVSAAALRFFAVSTLRAEKAHPFAVVACYTALWTDLFLPKNQHTGPTTDDGFHPASVEPYIMQEEKDGWTAAFSGKNSIFLEKTTKIFFNEKKEKSKNITP